MKSRLSRRDFLKATGLVSASTILAACAPGTAPTQEASTGAAAADTTTSDAAAGERVTVEFMNWWGDHREPLMDQVIENFHALNEDVFIENLVQPWDNRVERAATAIASSTPPGLIMTLRVETYKFANEGLIIPITEYVNASGINPDEIFYAGEINNQRLNGDLWSFPVPTGGGNSGQYFYSKKLFREAGLDPESPPTTWSELEEAAKAITKADDIGIDVLGFDVNTGPVPFPTWLYSNNGQYINNDATELLFNSAEGIETLDWMVNFTNEINGGIENATEFWSGTSDTSADYPFYTDKAASLFTGVWQFGHLLNTDPEMWEDTDAWGVGLRPYNDKRAGATNHGVSGLDGAWGYVIPTNVSKEVQDAAYRYVEYFGTNKDGGCFFLFEQGRPSPVRECNQDQAYYDSNPYWSLVLDSLESDVSIPVTPVQNQVTDILNTAIEEVFFGVKGAEEALNEAAEKGNEILNEFWSNA